MSALSKEQTISLIEKLGELSKLSDLFSEEAADRITSRVKELAEWKKATKQQLASAGLPQCLDQIPQLLPCNPVTNESILSIQSLAPLFSLYNLDASKGTLTALLDKISSSKNLDDAVTKKLTELGLSVNSDSINKLCLPNVDYIVEKVYTLRPEYLTGTWFNTQGRPFKLNLELDWVHRLYGAIRSEPQGPMDIWLYRSTGENIWDFISEAHVHPTATKEFIPPKDGWIEFPANTGWKYLANDSPLNFIERIIESGGGRTIVMLKGGIGGWATFEHVADPEVTDPARSLLSKFSDPLYCARSDGKVVIKFKDSASRGTLLSNRSFPSGRTLVSNGNKLPF